jgi:hypothetical protein
MPRSVTVNARPIAEFNTLDDAPPFTGIFHTGVAGCHRDNPKNRLSKAMLGLSQLKNSVSGDWPDLNHCQRDREGHAINEMLKMELVLLVVSESARTTFAQ